MSASSSSDSGGTDDPLKLNIRRKKNTNASSSFSKKQLQGPTEKAVKGQTQEADKKDVASSSTTAAAEESKIAATAATLQTTPPTTKLADVVRAASSSAPNPITTVMRPALSSAKANTLQLKTSTPAGVVPAVSPTVVSGLSYAQQVSGSYKKSLTIEIISKGITPRPPPLDAGKPRPKTNAGLQGFFDGRWQDESYGMQLEHIRGCPQSAYLRAVNRVISSDQLFSLGILAGGVVEVYTTSLESATKLMLEGIEVEGRHLVPFPLMEKPTKVVFNRVPMRAEHEDLLNFLRRFGKVHGKVRAIPLKIGDEGLGRGVFGTSREAFITLNKGCTLPSGFYLNISGSRYWIDASTEAKCHACHSVGHLIADCPKRSGKTTERKVALKETTTAVVVLEKLPSGSVQPAIVEQPVVSVPEMPKEVKKNISAEIGAASTRGGTTASDEELNSQVVKKKRMTRRKKKADQTIMPPPISSKKIVTAAKRPHSEEETQSRSSKVAAIESDATIDQISDCEMAGFDGIGGSNLSGYESCGSTVSVSSRFEVAKEIEHIPREKIKKILDELHYKKNPEKIWNVLVRELKNPELILPQLEILQKESKMRQKYNEVARCERLSRKIEGIIQEHRLIDSSPQ